MCYERALSALNLEYTDLIPQVEFLQHTDFIKLISGLNPFEKPREALKRTLDKLDMDMIWLTNDYFDAWTVARARGESFITSGKYWSKLFPTTWRVNKVSWSLDEVLEFNPLDYWTLPSIDELVSYFATIHSAEQEFFENQLVPGGSYLTLFMWPVMVFGLKATLRAAIREPEEFGKVLDRFGELSLAQFKAWSRTGIKAFISHDDICSNSGPLLSPRWLRKYIYPWYRRLWSELRDKGIVVLFCSDGDLTPIIDDITSLGVDGFILEECSNLSYIVEKYGGEKVIIGGVDIGVLTLGTPRQVVQEVERCVSIAGSCPGYFLNVSGSIPDNVPLENLQAYFKACEKLRKRNSRLIHT